MEILTRRVLPSEAKRVRADLKALATQVRKDALSLGDKGEAVKALQRHLFATGLYTGAVSGNFDAATEAALKQFQEAKGLPATGQVSRADYLTLSRINTFVRDDFQTAAREGQRGTDVLSAEKKLAKLGFLARAKADGVFDGDTRKAVRWYRKADHQVPDEGEAISKRLYSELKKASAGYEHAPVRRRSIGNVAGHAKADARTARLAARPGGIGLGCKDAKAVATVERHLEKAGYQIGGADGTFNTRTEAGVRAFQKGSGLPETGVVDPKTWSKLRACSFAAKSNTSPAMAVGEVGGNVRSIEKKLKKLHYDVGRVDGRFDTRLKKAVARFQARHHLGVSGKVGGGTLKGIDKALADDLGPIKSAVGYWNGVRRTIKIARVGPCWMEVGAARAFKAMQAAAKRAGVSLYPKGSLSGFRTWAQQDYMVRSGYPAWPAGHPKAYHQRGVAVDINEDAPTLAWMARNMGRFGFHRPYPNEQWHFEYWGGYRG